MTLENIIENGMTSGGTKFKPCPYRFYFIHIIIWKSLKLKDRFINLEKPLKRFLTGGFGILFLAILGLFTISDFKSCTTEKNKKLTDDTNDQIPKHQELNKSIEIDSLENYQQDSFQDSINNARLNLNSDTDSSRN